jgi:hypothetical protein
MITDGEKGSTAARRQLREQRRPCGRLLHLAAVCPGCGTPPALRVTETVARILGEQAAEERIATYQCQQRDCRRIYDLTAGAVQPAGHRRNGNAG